MSEALCDLNFSVAQLMPELDNLVEFFNCKIIQKMSHLDFNLDATS